MFGISFTLIHLNQAGALVHVYSDGSIHLNHGGTEMGQGLFTKVAQVVAEEFGVPLDFVRITATNTAKVPNASPTAASSGTDLNGMAAKIAAARSGAAWPPSPPGIGACRREGRVPRRPCLWRQRLDELRGARQGLPAGARAALARLLAFDESHRTIGKPPRKPRAEGGDFIPGEVIAIADEVNRANPCKQDEGRCHTSRQDGTQPLVRETPAGVIQFSG